ncbi:hypothetical protein FQN60_014389, partial [Etheostoma spectabile]
MDNLGNLTSGQNAAALVMLAFLQADCRTSEYGKELLSLGKDLNLTRDINFNGPEKDSLEDGDIETDGHLPVSITAALDDIQPSVELQWPRNRAEAADLQQIAYGLREIADQLEHNQWKDYLTREVRRVMSQGVGLEHLPQERVMMALTLTLVKSVCEQAPWLLRNLFHTALQYINAARASIGSSGSGFGCTGGSSGWDSTGGTAASSKRGAADRASGSATVSGSGGTVTGSGSCSGSGAGSEVASGSAGSAGVSTARDGGATSAGTGAVGAAGSGSDSGSTAGTDEGAGGSGPEGGGAAASRTGGGSSGSKERWEGSADKLAGVSITTGSSSESREAGAASADTGTGGDWSLNSSLSSASSLSVPKTLIMLSSIPPTSPPSSSSSASSRSTWTMSEFEELFSLRSSARATPSLLSRLLTSSGSIAPTCAQDSWPASDT